MAAAVQLTGLWDHEIFFFKAGRNTVLCVVSMKGFTRVLFAFYLRIQSRTPSYTMYEAINGRMPFMVWRRYSVAKLVQKESPKAVTHKLNFQWTKTAGMWERNHFDLHSFKSGSLTFVSVQSVFPPPHCARAVRENHARARSRKEEEEIPIQSDDDLGMCKKIVT